METTKQKVYLENKIYMWIVALLPILSMYKSPISALDLGTFLGMPLIIFCYILHCSKKRDTLKITKRQQGYRKSFSILCGYILLITCANLLVGITYDQRIMANSEKVLMLFRCFKLVLSALVIIHCGVYLMDFSYFMKIYGRIVKLAVLYIVLQTICFYLMQTVLPPFITGLIREDYAYVLDYNYHMHLGLFRPMSFFYEPAHFSEYCIPFLTYLLFSKKTLCKTSFVQAIFVSLGILLSTSGIGCVFMGGMWLVVLLRSFKTQHAHIAFLLFLLFLCCLPVVFSISVFQKAIERLFTGGAIQIRMLSGYSVFADLNIVSQLFGIGYGNYPPSYAISMSYALISMGIIGTVIFICFIGKLIIENRGFSKALAVVLFFMLFVTMIFTTGFTLYLPCIIFSMKEKKIAKSCYDYPQYSKQRIAKIS